MATVATGAMRGNAPDLLTASDCNCAVATPFRSVAAGDRGRALANDVEPSTVQGQARQRSGRPPNTTPEAEGRPPNKVLVFFVACQSRRPKKTIVLR